MSDFPPEPLTGLQESAATLHELFLAYVAAGFSEAQAMQLTTAALAAIVTRALGGRDD